jgi:hypothetical protein
MHEAQSWDYTAVPPHEWSWDIIVNHWVKLVVGPNGLTYIGTDWNCQSGGDYFAGFQGFDEFLGEGAPPHLKMPEATAEEVRQHLVTHRTAGGAVLRLLHLNQTETLVPWRFFIHLDEEPIQMAVNLPSDPSELLLFEGALPVGEHTISFTLIFRLPTEESGGRQTSTRGEQRFTMQAGQRTTLRLATRRDETGLHTVCTVGEV